VSHGYQTLASGWRPNLRAGIFERRTPTADTYGAHDMLAQGVILVGFTIDDFGNRLALSYLRSHKHSLHSALSGLRSHKHYLYADQYILDSV
jgi:hypothetical protein